MCRLFHKLRPWGDDDPDDVRYPEPLSETYRRASRNEVRRQFDHEIIEAERIIKRMSDWEVRGE